LDDYIRLTNFLSVSVFVSVNNLTDKKYPASAFINPDIVDGAPLFLEPGLPRSFIASLRFKID
jgi:outer membrane receptor protein involved in Fe transport